MMRTMGIGTKFMMATMATLALAACADDAATPKASSGVSLDELEVATRSALPACDGAQESLVAFLADEQKLVVCVGGEWKDVSLSPGKDDNVPKSGNDGKGGSALVKVTPFASGDETCPEGGLQIDVGIDDNANGVLDGSEIDQTTKLCHSDTIRKRVVFVSSQTYTGDLGGVAGADAKCQSLASAVPSLGGKTFKAWVAKESASVTDRFTMDGRFTLVDGTLVAKTFTDFANTISPGSQVSGPPFAHAISLNEQGTAGPAEVWTGTLNGVGFQYTCSDWTSSDAEDGGIYGLSSAADQDWSMHFYSPCDTKRALYCFEQ